MSASDQGLLEKKNTLQRLIDDVKGLVLGWDDLAVLHEVQGHLSVANSALNSENPAAIEKSIELLDDWKIHLAEVRNRD